MFTAWPNSKLIIAFFLLIGTGSHTLCTCIRRSYFLRNWSRLYLIFNKNHKHLLGTAGNWDSIVSICILKVVSMVHKHFHFKLKYISKDRFSKPFYWFSRSFISIKFIMAIYKMYIISLHVKYQSINADLQITFMKNKNFK